VDFGLLFQFLAQYPAPLGRYPVASTSPPSLSSSAASATTSSFALFLLPADENVFLRQYYLYFSTLWDIVVNRRIPILLNFVSLLFFFLFFFIYYFFYVGFY
jgi:hypothetical protein